MLADRAPEGLTLKTIGQVNLAGFATPDDAHALVGAGLAEVTAGATSQPARQRAELPSIDDELVGRTDELAEIWDALGRVGVVTLAGVGGMGKTRLALEVAAGAVAAYDGAVWWIDLANATSADAVLPVAMAAVGAREIPGRSMLQAICDRFAEVSGVAVIDNCEHVLRPARDLVAGLRSAAPEMRVICTSREALGLRGEHLVPIGSLPVDDGMALFTERALAVRPDLDTDTNRSVIERVCTRLDGIPLAIELAAARCRSLTPTEIDELLDDRFRLLRGGRDGSERHRTLQAAVAWSYSLLDPDERTVFDQMAVFAGGTLIDGLVAVTGIDRFDVIDIVDRLVARSMVVATTTPLGSRYHQLETLRQYAEDRLVDAGTISDTRDRHLTWTQHLTRWIADCGGTQRGGGAFQRFCAEIDNLRVAVAHATDTGRHATAHQIVASIAEAAYCRPVYEVLDWVRPIHLDGDWTDEAAECAASGGLVDFMRGIEVPLRPIGGVPERFLTSNPFVGLRQALIESFRPGRLGEALALLEQIPRETDRHRVAVDTYWLLAQSMRLSLSGPDDPLPADDLAEIRRRGRAAIETARRLGDELEYGSVLLRCGFVLEHHTPGEALELANEAADICERLGATALRDYALGVQLRCLGRTAAAGGPDSPTRMRQLRDAIVRARCDGSDGVARVLTLSAFGWIADSEPEVALTLTALNPAGTRMIGYLERAGIPIPDDWTEWERRASALGRDGVMGQVMVALDRAIAVADATAAGGES